MTRREALHQLIDALPEDRIPRAEEVLREVKDGADNLQRLLALAPPDDEPQSEDGRRLVEEALRDVAEGRVYSHKEVKQDLGIE